MNSPTFNPFLIGCIGALAPEIIRVYKLRLSPTVQWSWGYLLFSVPFILLGGFMAYILEPTTNYAAFYTGVSTPFIVTTLAKDSERDAQAIRDLTRDKERLEAELSHRQQSPTVAVAESDNTSGHSALRSTYSASSGRFPTSTNRYAPQSLSRRFRPRLSRWQLVQAFLKAI